MVHLDFIKWFHLNNQILPASIFCLTPACTIHSRFKYAMAPLESQNLSNGLSLLFIVYDAARLANAILYFIVNSAYNFTTKCGSFLILTAAFCSFTAINVCVFPMHERKSQNSSDKLVVIELKDQLVCEVYADVVVREEK